MKKQGMYSFLPRMVQARGSLFNPMSFLYNYESCYQEREHSLREKILIHRKSVHFSYDITLLDSSWFNSDFNVAFENVNKDSYLFTAQYRPFQKLSMNDFRVVEYDNAIYKWDSLRLLEVDIADFLLMRNKLIAQYRPEHLNEPLNFFFIDLKHIVRTIAKEENINVILNILNSFVDYINYVETELPFDSQDRLFIGQMRESININIKPQIYREIQSNNLRSKLENVLSELDGILDESNRLAHYSFQDKEISPHAISAFDLISKDEEFRYPTISLINCAKNKNQENIPIQDEAMVQASSDYGFHELMFSNVHFDIHMLEQCNRVNLMNGLSEDNKLNYVELVSQINRLLEFKRVLKFVLRLFDEMGQYNLILDFKAELEEYLRALSESLSNIKISYDKVKLANQDLKNDLLIYRSKLTPLNHAVSSMVSLTGWLDSTNVDYEKFIFNQDIKYLTQSKQPEKVFDGLAGSLDEVLQVIKLWDESYRQGSTQTSLNGFYQSLRYNMIKISRGNDFIYDDDHLLEDTSYSQDPSTLLCNYAQDIEADNYDFECHADNYDAYFYSLSDSHFTNNLNDGLIGSHNDIYSCHFNPGKFQHEVNCEASSSLIKFVSKGNSFSSSFLTSINQQVALGMVLFNIGKSTYQWTLKWADNSLASSQVNGAESDFNILSNTVKSYRKGSTQTKEDRYFLGDSDFSFFGSTEPFSEEPVASEDSLALSSLSI